MSELHRLTATAALKRIGRGLLDPADLIEACLARIAAREPDVRAMAFFDPDQARRTRWQDGPLQGIPIGAKDVMDTADMPTEHGSPIWRGWRPRADAAAVSAARAAGAIVMGKTVTAEFAIRTPGPTRHPLTLRHTPGGSSSGSAAGVADGFFPLAFGTQAMGSLIKPAAYCGVVGFKPSFGIINRGGVKLVSDSIDTVGVLARCVADCALLVEAVSGLALGDPEIRPDRPPRIGLCRSPSWSKALPETAALLPAAATALSRAGATIVERELPPAFDAAQRAFPIILNREAAQALGWELRHAADQVSAPLREQLAMGAKASAADYRSAVTLFEGLRRLFPAALDGLDVLITPAATGQAPETLASTGDSAFNWLWTALHLPAISVPAGIGPDGLPLGLQIVGRFGEDRQTLAWAQWIAAALA